MTDLKELYKLRDMAIAEGFKKEARKFDKLIVKELNRRFREEKKKR